LTSRDPVFSFFQLPTRFWELGLGLLLALSAKHWNRYLQSHAGLVLNVIGPFLRRLPRAATVAVMLLTVSVAAVVSRIAFNFEPLLSLSVTANLDLWSSGAPANSQTACAPKISTNKLASGTVVLMSPLACSPQNGARIFVAGDSHAGAYTRMLDMLSSRDGFFVSLYSVPGCPFFNFRDPFRLLGRSCGEFTRATENSIKESAHSGDFLFLPSLRLTRHSDAWGDQQQLHPASEANEKEAVQEAVDFIQDIRDRGLKIILEGPLPLFKSPPFRCSDWFNHMNSICQHGFTVSRAEIDLRRSRIMQVEANIANAVPGVSIWDPVPVLCNEGTCDAFDHGKPVFADTDHLSGYGNRVLYESFRSHLAAASTSLR
jgi:hypothetical protein